MNNKLDNSKLVEAMKQFKAVRTVIFQEEFYKVVVDTTFLVPVAVDKSEGDKKSGKYCALKTDDNRTFLSVFSSEEELEKSYGHRDDVIGVRHNFVTIREVVTKENSGLNGFIIDEKGENVAILREEMLPKN